MLHQKNTNSFSHKEMNLAIGQNFTEFSDKLNALQNEWKKWIEKGDSIELRLISPILFQKTTPINLSIIADNLQYFKENYKKSYENNLEKALQIASLCGSQAIAEYLLKELKVDFADKKYDFVLSYASASLNDEWTLNLANTMKNVEKDLPSEVYLFCHDIDLLDNIKSIFNETKKDKVKKE